jgi:hypothetical protein
MMNDRGTRQPTPDGTADILYLVDRLEELVGVGKRVPFSTRVMVEEEEFIALVDQLREAVPNEIKQAQRVIRERERIVGEAQAEAGRIIEKAEVTAERLVSQNGILIEARQRSEEMLRLAEESSQRTRGEVDAFMLEQIELVVSAVNQGMAKMEAAVEQTIDIMENAREAVGRSDNF